MTIKVNGYAAASSTDSLEPYAFERRDPRAQDVVIDILYCGVCHSDIHSVRNEWHSMMSDNYNYPLTTTIITHC